MIPFLFDANETSYTSHGLGELPEATSCEVEEEANGAYTLTLEIPITARHFPDIQRRRQILARPNPTDQPQPFRIFRVTRPLRGAVTVFARHVSYDLTGVVIGPFTASTAAQAVERINARAINTNAFTLSTDLEASGRLSVTVPTAARSLLGPVDRDNTLLRVYGGDLRFDRYAVELLQQRGADHGFEVAYGVNMTELRADEDGGEVYAGILPYWTDGDTTVQGAIQWAPGVTQGAVQPVDLSEEFDDQPTVRQLNTHGAAYVERNKPYLPRQSFQVSFVPPGSRGLHTLEQLGLFDEVSVRYERLGVSVKKTVVKTTWDVLRDRYRSVEIGERRIYVSETIAAPITAKKIAPGAVGGGALARNAVGTENLKDAAVSGSKLQDSAVESNKIAESAVTAGKIKDSEISNAKVVPGTLDSSSMTSGVRSSLAGGTQAANVFAGTSTATYIKATYSTLGQLTLMGNDCRWASLTYPDGVTRLTLVADNS